MAEFSKQRIEVYLSEVKDTVKDGLYQLKQNKHRPDKMYYSLYNKINIRLKHLFPDYYLP